MLFLNSQHTRCSTHTYRVCIKKGYLLPQSVLETVCTQVTVGWGGLYFALLWLGLGFIAGIVNKREQGEQRALHALLLAATKFCPLLSADVDVTVSCGFYRIRVSAVHASLMPIVKSSPPPAQHNTPNLNSAHSAAQLSSPHSHCVCECVCVCQCVLLSHTQQSCKLLLCTSTLTSPPTSLPLSASPSLPLSLFAREKCGVLG